jgi:hypothetical protein
MLMANQRSTVLERATGVASLKSCFSGMFGRRLAIRAAKFGPKPTATFVRRENTATEFQHREKRGAIEGPIRIPLHSQLFLFNTLAFPGIPSNSLKFRSVVFSIPTAPTNLLHLLDTHTYFAL